MAELEKEELLELIDLEKVEKEDDLRNMDKN